MGGIAPLLLSSWSSVVGGNVPEVDIQTGVIEKERAVMSGVIASGRKLADDIVTADDDANFTPKRNYPLEITTTVRERSTPPHIYGNIPRNTHLHPSDTQNIHSTHFIYTLFDQFRKQ